MARLFDSEVVRAFLLLTLLVGLLGCDSSTDDALPALPVMLFPANGATDQVNALELQWNAAPDAETYHVQLSSNANFSSSEVDEQGLVDTYLAVRGLQLGTTYYWHVRAGNASGFSAWSPTWTFTPTSVAVMPEQPALLLPSDGAASQPKRIVFRWEAASGANWYHIQVSLEPTFLRRVADLDAVRHTNQQVTGLVNTYTYYWRIRAGNPAGYSAWSPTWSLVVDDGQ